tara:strand:- start:687 stop:2144 length:1458 start_codon:yes stop_codon:yes gene_type:complete
MAEIKPMNLPGVSFDPRQGLPQQKTLSENLRGVAERKFMREMSKYQMKKLDREEKDYAVMKKAENFIFSNYPSSKAKGDFTTAFDNRKFGPGSREKELAKWKEQVGGNYGAFQQWYDAGKKAENDALFKSFYKNPAKYKSDKAYRTAISNWMNDMSDAEQQEILNTAPPEVLTILQQNWDAYNPTFGTSIGRFFDENLTFGQGEDDDSMLPEALVVGGGALGTAIATKKIGPIIQAAKGLFNKSGSVGKRGLDNLKDLTKGNKVEKEILEKGINKADDYRNFRASSAIPHKNIEGLDRELAKLVKDGGMNRSDALKLKGVINGIMSSGKELTPEAIGGALRKGGKDKFGSLMKTLNSYNKSLLGPIRMSGLIGGMTGYAVGNMAFEQGAKALGASDEMASTIGNVGGISTSNPAGAYQMVRAVINKKGPGYVTKKILAVGGPKLLASMSAKALLGGSGIGALLAGGLLINDLFTIANILKDDIEE